VDGVVVESGGEDAVVGIGQDGGQGDEAGSLWPVKHLGLEPGELVLEVGEVLGEGLNDAGVEGPDDGLIGGAQILGTFQGTNIVAPKLGLVCKGRVGGVEVKMHFTKTLVGHSKICELFNVWINGAPD